MVWCESFPMSTSLTLFNKKHTLVPNRLKTTTACASHFCVFVKLCNLRNISFISRYSVSRPVETTVVEDNRSTKPTSSKSGNKNVSRRNAPSSIRCFGSWEITLGSYTQLSLSLLLSKRCGWELTEYFSTSVLLRCRYAGYHRPGREISRDNLEATFIIAFSRVFTCRNQMRVQIKLQKLN